MHIIRRGLESLKKRHMRDKVSVFGATCARVFDKIHVRLEACFGMAHIDALREVCNYDLQFLLTAVTNVALELLSDTIKVYTEQLGEAMQPMMLPEASFGAAGCFLGIEMNFSNINEYDDLGAVVFQGFRELGNCIALLDVLDRGRGMEHLLLSRPIKQALPRVMADFAKSCAAHNHQVNDYAALAKKVAGSADGDEDADFGMFDKLAREVLAGWEKEVARNGVMNIASSRSSTESFPHCSSSSATSRSTKNAMGMDSQ